MLEWWHSRRGVGVIGLERGGVVGLGDGVTGHRGCWGWRQCVDGGGAWVARRGRAH
jgi:hypothetical protein